jgi:hypothetical protein
MDELKSSETQQRSGPLTALLTAAIGTTFVVVACVFAMRTLSFAADASKTEGVVISLLEDGDNASAPVVQYLVDGKTYQIEGNVYTSPPAFSIGEAVTIAYKSDRPDAGQIVSVKNLWVIAVFGFVGASAAVQGFRDLIISRRPRSVWRLVSSLLTGGRE